MKVQLHHPEQSISSTLRATAAALTEDRVSIRQLLEQVGEQGMLVLSMLVCVPFLLPITIPGSSTPFGLVIALVGIGVMLDRVPWLPKWLLDRSFARTSVVPLLERGANLFARMEKLVHPRLLALTHGSTLNRLNGAALTLSAILLMVPLPIPLSNTFPGWGCMLLSAGISQRDGVVVLLGYLLVLISIAYFAVIGWATYTGAAWATRWFGVE